MITAKDLADKARELQVSTPLGALVTARELADMNLAYEVQEAAQLAAMQADTDGLDRLMAAVQSQEDLEWAVVEAIIGTEAPDDVYDGIEDDARIVARAILPIITAYADQRAAEERERALARVLESVHEEAQLCTIPALAARREGLMAARKIIAAHREISAAPPRWPEQWADKIADQVAEPDDVEIAKYGQEIESAPTGGAS